MKPKNKKQLIKNPKLGKNILDHEKIMRRYFMKNLKFYRCNKCKKIIVTLHDSACGTFCCGEEMVDLTANTTDGATEKHVPVVTREGSKITVNVGDVDHPMLDVHYIEFIALQTEKGFRIAYLEPGDKPCADFYEEEPVIAVYGYCNLHGLWKTEA